ncbi:MAG: hypothetical protein AABN33_21355 [Acidobacteriota bacterium]
MSTEITSIQVEPDIADAYNSASQEDQKKIQLLMRLWLRELSTQPNMSLTEVMDMISDRAQARGLTPEILESIFVEEQRQ